MVKHAPDASDTAMNEAVRRLGGYLFDMPEAARGDGYANALRNSGAMRMLLPYRIHRAGYSDAVEAAQAAVGSVGNPVTGLAVESGQLVVTFEDMSTDALDLPAGQDAEDQTARDAAAAAAESAANAQRAAAAASTAAAAASTAADTHGNSTHNTDQTARDAAAAAQTAAAASTAAQSAVDAHGRTTHNTDQTARDAAAAASAAAATAGGGQPPTVLYEAATAAIGGSTALIAGNVVCPETGDLEFYFEGLTGSRQGGVAYARIPAARIRGAVSALAVAYNNDNENVLVIPHGANRGIGIAVQATTFYMMLNAQAAGNFNIRILHIG